MSAQPSAAERAMQDIQAVLDEHYEGRAPDALNTIARIVGTYNMEKIGEHT